MDSPSQDPKLRLMDSPSQDPKLSLMQLPSMDDDAVGSMISPIGRYTAVLTPDAHGVFSPKITGVALERPPKIHITLLPRKLVTHVVGTCIFLAVFTGVAYNGVVVFRKTQDSLDAKSTEEVDNKVELFNAISGFLIALVEVMLGVYMSNFLPTFQVYLHNMLWFLHGGAKATKVSNATRSFLMFVFPVFLMLVIGQCLRSFQASQSSVGFKTIMKREDFTFDRSAVEIVQLYTDDFEKNASAKGLKEDKTNETLSRIALGVLKTAATGLSTPLNIMAPSVCSSKRGKLSINLDDMAGTNLAFGFPAQEWYSEMLDQYIDTTPFASYVYSEMRQGADDETPLQPRPDFDLKLASDMYASAKIILDRMVAESTTDYAECTNFNSTGFDTLLFDAVTAKTDAKKARVKCDSSFRTLYEIGNFQAKEEEERTIEELTGIISTSLFLAVDNMDSNTVNITFGRYDVSDLANVETMSIEADIEINPENNPFYEVTGGLYRYGAFAQDLCGTENCVFIDTNNTLELPRELLMVPYQKNCTYNDESIKYVRDVRSFMPADCQKQPNEALVISISSSIAANFYGSDLSIDTEGEATLPGFNYPWRRLRMSISKIKWKVKDLEDELAAQKVECRREQDCKGLSSRLTKTGRYVFVGEEFIPTKEIMDASLAVPIRLVQLNPARFYIEGLVTRDGNQIKQALTPERVNWDLGYRNFYAWDWVKSLTGTECSSFMDAYINHINDNNLYIEGAEDVIYRSAMFYLFSKASVTEFSDAELAKTTAINATLDDKIKADILFNLKLKGDIQFRDIRVRVPVGTFYATAIGCALLFLIALVVVIQPKRPMEYFAPTVTTPDKYIVLKNSHKYPDVVHTKTLLFPASGESLPMEDFDVDEMTLVNQTDQTDELQFWDWSR